MLISLVETRLLKEKEIRIPCYSQIFRNERSGNDGGIIVGQTLSNVCFVKVSIVWISVEWLWILKLGKNFWEKERGFFLCFNNDRVSLNCSKSNLVFIVKRCIIRLFATAKMIVEAKLRLLIVLQIMHPAFPLFFYQQLIFLWKNYWINKKFVLQSCLIKVHKEPIWLKSEKYFAAGADMHRKNFYFQVWKQGMWV